MHRGRAGAGGAVPGEPAPGAEFCPGRGPVRGGGGDRGAVQLAAGVRGIPVQKAPFLLPVGRIFTQDGKTGRRASPLGGFVLY